MTKKRKTDDKGDRLTYRFLTVFTFVIIAIMGLMQVYKFYNKASTMVATRNTLFVLAGVAVLSILACAVIYFLSYRNEKLIKRRNMVLDFSLLAAVIAACCLFMAFFYSDAVRVLYFVIPIGALLYFVYLIYQREFFIISLLTLAGSFGSWVLSKLFASTGSQKEAVTLAVVFIAVTGAAALLLALLKKNKGVLQLGKIKAALIDSDCMYRFLFITCGLLVLSFACAMAFGAMAAYYALFIMIGYLFIMAVYYTVKLM